jgi:hypothetical protein
MSVYLYLCCYFVKHVYFKWLARAVAYSNPHSFICLIVFAPTFIFLHFHIYFRLSLQKCKSKVSLCVDIRVLSVHTKRTFSTIYCVCATNSLCHVTEICVANGLHRHIFTCVAGVRMIGVIGGGLSPQSHQHTV